MRGLGSVTPVNGARADLPGLTKTVTVPAGSVAFVTADGGLMAPFGGLSIVAIEFSVDGAIPTGSRVVAADFGSVGAGVPCSASRILQLSPGQHTITVQARGFSPGEVSADSLTVIVIRPA